MHGYMIVTVFLAAGFMTACIFIKRYYQNRMAAEYQGLLMKLDRAISGEIQDTTYDESMDAAITERLNRVVQIAWMNQDRAERERDTVKSLISDVSHQVRTPLTNIMLYAGLLQEQDLEREAMALAGKIQKQCTKLDFFMKELVRSSYAEQEMISIHPEKTGVEEMINTACQMVEVAALKKRIHIVKEAAEVSCYADKKWTTEAIGNVLDNAVKYSPEDSQIKVRVIPCESFICIRIEDQGIGIREEEQGLVFERFYRSGDVSGEPGFGIGLYLVREVLAKQGGYARIKSEIGKGTAVQLYLSRYEA